MFVNVEFNTLKFSSVGKFIAQWKIPHYQLPLINGNVLEIFRNVIFMIHRFYTYQVIGKVENKF